MGSADTEKPDLKWKAFKKLNIQCLIEWAPKALEKATGMGHIMFPKG